MKKTLLFSLMGLLISALSFGQCTNNVLDWSYRRFLKPDTYVSTAMAATQSFSFGTNKLQISFANGVTTAGDNRSVTATGASTESVEFANNGTVTLTFSAAVTNSSFAIYDIDDDQTIAVTAFNGSTPVTPSITKLGSTAGNKITIAGSAAKGAKADEKLNVLDASIKVDVSGPVTSIILTITTSNSGGGSDPTFFLSNISACTSGSFPTNYYSVSQPWGNMPGYVLTAVNNSVYMVDPVTGNAKWLFTDGASSATINSLAYDPYNKIIYYCYSLTNNGSANASQRGLQKYDLNTEQSTTIVPDIRTLGIPTFTQGVESGAAAFYDGALYLGIEGSADNGNGGPKTSGGYESIIWRIDFSGTVPTSAMQVYAVSGDTHDWSDFSINDGTLYDFNGEANASDYMHVNMQTGSSTKFAATTPARQSAVGWDGKIYWVTNQIGQYNLSGNVPIKVNITSTPAIPNWSNTSAPSFGDAAEAFRPKADFGDAPNSFDPIAQSPAVHEISSNLLLGVTSDNEWTKSASASANLDGGDEDGLPYVSLLNQNGGKYFTEVNVYNNTGAPATLAGWVDFNNDGDFDVSEGIVLTVNSMTTVQKIGMLWTGVTTSVANYSNVYLRIRLTSASNGMTASTPTGYFSNGEVEDYYVMVTPTPLPLEIVSFSATKSINNKVAVKWTAVDEEPGTHYQLQVSDDARNWGILSEMSINTNADLTEHTYVDQQPKMPRSFYRLRYKSNTGKVGYTTVRTVEWQNLQTVKLWPNPFTNQTTLELNAVKEGAAIVNVYGVQGTQISGRSFSVQKGVNHLPIGKMFFLRNGVYSLQIIIDGKTITQKLVVL